MTTVHEAAGKKDGMTEQNAPHTSGDAIKIRDVSVTYESDKGSVRALQPINLTIKAGEFVSVVGPSGCGKSTLLLAVAGLLRPTSGSIEVGDTTLESPMTDVGIVFQDHLLLEFRTALENVLLQGRVRGMPIEPMRERADALFQRLNLAGAERRWPHQLSGGMRQRVSIVRALIHNPPILLMDEPFGALDAMTRMQLRHDLEQLWMEQRKTVLFITHSVEEAVGLSDRVIVMSPGPGHVVEEIEIDLPRPRPLALGESPEFTRYTDRIYRIFEDLGVLHT